MQYEKLLSHDESEVLRIDAEAWCHVLNVTRQCAAGSMRPEEHTRFANLVDDATPPLERCAALGSSTADPLVTEARERLVAVLEAALSLRTTIEHAHFVRFSGRWLAWIVSEAQELDVDDMDEDFKKSLRAEMRNASVELEDVLKQMQTKLRDDAGPSD